MPCEDFFISSGRYSNSSGIIRPDELVFRPDNIIIRSDELYIVRTNYISSGRYKKFLHMAFTGRRSKETLLGTFCVGYTFLPWDNVFS